MSGIQIQCAPTPQEARDQILDVVRGWLNDDNRTPVLELHCNRHASPNGQKIINYVVQAKMPIHAIGEVHAPPTIIGATNLPPNLAPLSR